MSTTDISEKGLETLIMRHMTGSDLPAEASAQAGGLAFAAEGIVAETPDTLAAAKAAGSGWLAGNPKDYDRTHALDGQREGGGAPCAEPFQRHAPVALQHGRNAPGAGPVPVH